MRPLVYAGLLALLPASVTLALPAAQTHHAGGVLSAVQASAWVHDHLQGWPPRTIALAVSLVQEYGRPEDVAAHRITWYHNGPWQRTSLLREGAPHNFPLRHMDVLEQTVDYRVPLNKIADLVSYNGSLVVDRTRGELTVHSDSEQENIITLNIADDIVKGERTVDQAMGYHAQVIEGLFIHDPETYQLRLRFHQQPSADPGEEAELLEHLHR